MIKIFSQRILILLLSYNGLQKYLLQPFPLVMSMLHHCSHRVLLHLFTFTTAHESMLIHHAVILQMYKGFDKIQHVQHVYTDASESLCGVKFDIHKYQYLITGKDFL